MKRITALLFMTLMASPAQNSEPLLEHRWKHRLVIAHVTPDDAKAVIEQWRKQQAEVKDRDLKLIDVSPQPMGGNLFLRPEADELDALRKFAGVKADAPSTFVLVGKDGGVKSRQTGKLQVKDFFALIDTMPMRQREMREKDGG